MCSFGNIAIGVGTIICVIFLYVLSEYFRTNKRRFISKPIIQTGITDTNPLVEYHGENESTGDSGHAWRFYEEVEKVKQSETSFTIEDRDGSEEELFVRKNEASVSPGYTCQMGSEEISEMVSNG